MRKSKITLKASMRIGEITILLSSLSAAVVYVKSMFNPIETTNSAALIIPMVMIFIFLLLDIFMNIRTRVELEEKRININYITNKSISTKHLVLAEITTKKKYNLFGSETVIRLVDLLQKEIIIPMKLINSENFCCLIGYIKDNAPNIRYDDRINRYIENPLGNFNVNTTDNVGALSLKRMLGVTLTLIAIYILLVIVIDGTMLIDLLVGARDIITSFI